MIAGRRATVASFVRGRRPRYDELVRRVGRPGLRLAKTTIAATLAYVVADWIGTSTGPVLAPLTALLVVQVTMYQTVTQSVQRVASVLAGVLVAVAVAHFVGLTWWSLAGVVAVSLLLGGLLRLGPHLLELPISAMLVLAVGGAPAVAGSRIYETLIGAAAGVLVNVVIAPPLYLQPAGEALGELADRMARFTDALATALRSTWSRADADRWLDDARALGREVALADRNLARAEESTRLNPRAARIRQEQPRLRTALTGLDRTYLAVRELCRALLDRTYFVPAEEQTTAYDDDVRTALAAFLDTVADAVRTVGSYASTTRPVPRDALGLEAHLEELRRRRDRLSTLLLVDPHTDPAAWEQHGALLTAVDRMRVEVEAAARPAERSWRPPVLAERQRETFRRLRRNRRRRSPRPPTSEQPEPPPP
ncbi:FUSC family protein [Pseudonocardia dioxanivorans]|uniref:FUSC family protein n=1 Tax=Pseudonocardia dioxanivorans TaxID=240495 RepID=UPI000CD2E857|nr:aromatic acid exporter family protein [Pseudonocardia dioxanivorans]